MRGREIWIWDDRSAQAIPAYAAKDRRRFLPAANVVASLRHAVQKGLSIRREYRELVRHGFRTPVSFANAIGLALEAGNDLLLFANQHAYDPELPSKVIDVIEGMVGSGTYQVTLSGVTVDVPEMLAGASGPLILGVRPENVQLDDAAPYRGRVIATEYLGTTQIVTFDTANGQLKARVGSDKHVSVGTATGLTFDQRSITLFDGTTGRALLSHANRKVLAHG